MDRQQEIKILNLKIRNIAATIRNDEYKIRGLYRQIQWFKNKKSQLIGENNGIRIY